MKMKLKYLLILTIISVFISCKYNEVELIKVSDYSIGNFSGDNVDINMNIEVNNPNNYNIKIKKTTLDLFVDGKKIGEAPMQQNIVLEKNNQKNYPLTVRANYKDLSKSLFSNITDLFEKKSVKLGIKGKVKASAYGVVGKKFDLEVEEEINLQELIKGKNFSL